MRDFQHSKFHLILPLRIIINHLLNFFNLFSDDFPDLTMFSETELRNRTDAETTAHVDGR